MKGILDQKLLKKFLKTAGETLSGEWVLIGGTVLPALEQDIRVTLDIDLIALDDAAPAQTIKLMEIAEALGLPVETINQAGSYYFRKLRGSREHLVLLIQGKHATIYRPDVTLFLRLKIPRLTEADLTDCLAFLKVARNLEEPLEKKEIKKLLESELKADPAPGRKERLNALFRAIR
ncbi:MAG: hypothetical protein A2603_04020 [Bdellovibrionales bacterium RIFOXYD1_FULL_55_31]|nr:MAG: hypothetical protein A2603_04020 [Bdellovibrionales bacterium RIFOXYD1_FULL_55_31]